MPKPGKRKSLDGKHVEKTENEETKNKEGDDENEETEKKEGDDSGVGLDQSSGSMTLRPRGPKQKQFPMPSVKLVRMPLLSKPLRKTAKVDVVIQDSEEECDKEERGKEDRGKQKRGKPDRGKQEEGGGSGGSPPPSSSSDESRDSSSSSSSTSSRHPRSSRKRGYSPVAQRKTAKLAGYKWKTVDVTVWDWDNIYTKS